MKIGAYEVLEELGRGGMGAVYRVRGPDGREAAIKVLLGADRERVLRFERERRLLDSLGEAGGFVELLDAGVSGETAWLLMPLVPGGTLRQRLAAGPLGVEETIALGKELATALGRAHERGIVHRDVKPENIIFTARGRPLLADLGLAKHFDRDAPGTSQSVELTARGTLKGTAGYMAPEQVDDAASAGPPADVFALGAVLHECLAGRSAFQGRDLLEVLTKLASGRVEPIGRPDVPAWLEAALVRALAHEPGERFANGAAFAIALAGAPGTRRSLLAPIVLALAVLLAVGVLALARTGKPVDLHSPAPAPARSSEARALAARGEEAIAHHDWSAAIADCSKAIELDPTLALAWATRGGARGNAGDWEGEIADSTKAIALDPTLALAWSNRGIGRRHKGDWDGALADCEKAVELLPGFAGGWVSLGDARLQKHDMAGAIADCTRAIELDPGLALAWAERSTVRSEQQDWDGVIADATKAIELDPRLPVAWVNRGRARSYKGDFDGEIADCTKAIELDPKSIQAWENRGQARCNKDKPDFDGAIADFTKAIELDPGDGLVWLDRGTARYSRGDGDGAIADATRAIELSPARAHSWLVRGIARLQKNDRGGALDVERSLELGLPEEDAASARKALDDARKLGLR
jgi:tetratricopeptide (TPR) repeat protein